MIPLEEIANELEEILTWWRTYGPDLDKGGFHGRIGNDNSPDPAAEKGAVLNARILWTFSTSYQRNGNPRDFQLAQVACEYLQRHFLDPVHGGLYWSVTASGLPADMHKQIYAQAFGIYGLCAYFRASGNRAALETAIALFECIERFGFDRERGGYLEAFSREWKERNDQRLSEKEINAPKTMNTHLHVIEAYGALCEVWPDARVKNKILHLLDLFITRIVDPATGHLVLFFDRRWQKLPGVFSYGHDIEAGWLLLECARKTDDPALTQRISQFSLPLILAGLEGLDADGGLWYEYDPLPGRPVREKHWWPQAECLVGLLNAWEMTGDEEYLELMERNWSFINKHLKDRKNGEWFWGVDERSAIIKNQDKAGFWKGPYHNARCCLEILRRKGQGSPLSLQHTNNC